MYGKLENGEVVYAPAEYEVTEYNGEASEASINVIHDFNKSISLMSRYGFKPVVDIKPHYIFETQYCEFLGYEDNGTYIVSKYEVKDIEPSEAEILNQETELALSFLNFDISDKLVELDDEQALQVKNVFPKFAPDVEYKKDHRVLYLDVLYKVLMDHTSQADWTPDVSPSLFAKVLVGQVNEETGEQEILEWVQPDSTNPYMTGDMVIFEGVTYKSLIDNNTWSPVDYPAGWETI